MTQQATAPTEAPAAPPPAASAAAPAPKAEAPKAEPKIRVRAHDRARTIKEKILDEPESKADAAEESDATEPAEAKPEPKEPAAKAEDKPAEDDPIEQRRQARRERLLKAQEREREEARARASKKPPASRETHAEIERLRKRVAELEPTEAVFKDEETLLAAAEAKGMSPQKLVEWMRKRLSDPAAVAQHTASRETQALRDEWQKAKDELRREREALHAEKARVEEERAGQERAMRFVDQARQKAEDYPLTAALRERYGDNVLLAFANTLHCA